jgi:SAM-dependent methyltransferase
MSRRHLAPCFAPTPDSARSFWPGHAPCSEGTVRSLGAIDEETLGARPLAWPSVTSRLREGDHVDDVDFDDVFPFAARKISSAFWTPVSVAQRAAELLVDSRSTRVLDVGSGVGKFCIVGAASTGATFVGIEHREHFVDVARDAAYRLGVRSAHFIHGTLDAVKASDFDAFYFFNPFEENLWGCHKHLDDTVRLSKERFFNDVKRAQQMLGDARAGTRVVTYHGFGGVMPRSYALCLQERFCSGSLNLWVKSDSVTCLPIRPALDPVPRFLAG